MPKNLKEAAATEKYQLVAPIDYMILGFLPTEGTLVLGLYPLGETAHNIRLKLTAEQQKVISTVTIGARLRVMQEQGLVVSQHPGVGKRTTSGGNSRMVWQRTTSGTNALNKWKGGNGGSGSK